MIRASALFPKLVIVVTAIGLILFLCYFTILLPPVLRKDAMNILLLKDQEELSPLTKLKSHTSMQGGLIFHKAYVDPIWFHETKGRLEESGYNTFQEKENMDLQPHAFSIEEWNGKYFTSDKKMVKLRHSIFYCEETRRLTLISFRH